LLTLPGRKVLQEKVHTLSFSLLQPTFLPSNHNQADSSANKQPTTTIDRTSSDSMFTVTFLFSCKKAFGCQFSKTAFRFRKIVGVRLVELDGGMTGRVHDDVACHGYPLEAAP
jgi:hypothetical protein